MENKILNFKELRVWQLAIDFVDKIYDVTDAFPKREIYGLTSQLTRAAVSVASNIAEGSLRGSRKEFAQFVSIARGSLAEAETQIIIGRRRKFVQEQDFEALNTMVGSLHRMLMKLLRALQQT